MKIGLINPPYDFSRHSTSFVPPLGIATVAAMLEKEKHFVRILDCQAQGTMLEDVIAWIKKHDFDIIGLTSSTIAIDNAAKIIKLAKKKFPKLTTMVGGPHPTFDPKGSMKLTGADLLVYGEGEETIVDLIKNIKKPQKVLGIYYREEGKIKNTKPRPLTKDLNTLPWPARHLLDIKKYKPFAGSYKRLPSMQIMSTRGCPYNCSFCCSVFGRSYRKRDPKDVIEEIKHLIKKYGAKEIYFQDSLIVLDRKWIMEICGRIIKEKLDITWSGSARANLVDLELLKKMKKSGCFRLAFGVESGDPRVLKIVRKDVNVPKIKEAFKMCRKVGIATTAFYILGLPGDNRESCLRTIKLAKELNADVSSFNIATPFPGSDFYKHLDQYGKIYDFDLRHWTDDRAVYAPHGMTTKELENLRKYAMRQVYLNPRYIWKRITSIRGWQDIKNLWEGLRTILFKKDIF